MRRLSALLALCAFALAGCGPSPEPTKPSAPTAPTAPTATVPTAPAAPEMVKLPAKPKPAGGKYVIGMSQCNLGEPWRVRMNAELKEAADKYPNDIQMVWKDAQNRSEQQQSQVRELIQQKVDAIIISPKEARPLTRPVADAVDAGIPVIVLDRRVDGDKYTCFIGGDNVVIGREAGKYMVKILGGKGDIVELQGLQTSTPAKERHDGFMEGIKGSQIKIIFTADCQWLEPNAIREMKSALAVHPKIDAVYGHNDPSAHGAYLAALQEGKGREKTIKFIGIDANPNEGKRYVKDGIFAATFEYPTGGKEAIDTVLKLLKGEEVQKNVSLGTRIYTKDNIDKGGEAL